MNLSNQNCAPTSFIYWRPIVVVRLRCWGVGLCCWMFLSGPLACPPWPHAEPTVPSISPTLLHSLDSPTQQQGIVGLWDCVKMVWIGLFWSAFKIRNNGSVRSCLSSWNSQNVKEGIEWEILLNILFFFCLSTFETRYPDLSVMDCLTLLQPHGNTSSAKWHVLLDTKAIVCKQSRPIWKIN